MFAGHGFLLPDEAIRRVKQCEERLLEAAESAGLMLGMMSELLSVVGTLGPPGYHLFMSASFRAGRLPCSSPWPTAWF